MVLKNVGHCLPIQFVIDEDTITMETSFSEDLGADSLDIVELAMAVEEEFDIPELNEDDLPSLATVGDLVRYISNIID
jgi:acyl carrier protein